MQPQDIYNRDFDVAVAALDRWLDSLAGVAVVDRESTTSFWRARVTPHEANGCPAELLLSRNQTFDVEVGPEALIHQPVTGFSLFLPLLEAVAAGHVVHRCWSAVATGYSLTHEIIVQLAESGDWSMRRVVRAGTAATELAATARDHVYLPYRRG